ncbi:oxidoreductase [Sulfitobacter sp. SK012]|uniref:Gfo/Idh/MocA family protein n=1 Tax=Sulfitobacter sp. SK012 TaxID=1389005 RepID=UPI000E0B6339|nr:Gfo/Idh/MocA family oxidoreductase [Sulfitobacter sp. SK012]AXI47541.1 oxidoreductase [Sulfitobacter sp. SK012]
MAQPVKIAVVGAGLVGLRHIDAISQLKAASLVAVVEPSGAQFGETPVYSDLNALFDAHDIDGVVLSTPTPLHLDGAQCCLQHGVPVLVEKPLAASVSEAAQIVRASDDAEVPVLVGHHRRHNPLIQKAASLIKSRAIGDVRAAQATCWFYKPDDYFDTAPWRKQHGAGPISVNLVHDVDLMRYLCGEVVLVQAQMAPSRRGFENEDLAAAVLRFESGAICTITVSDSIAAPWSWEMTSAEYPVYPFTDQSCYLIGGSEGSLSVPDMRLWRHDGENSWWNSISATTMPRAFSNPLVNQIAHFADVIRGTVKPLVSAREGLRTMQVIEAIQTAAVNQTTVHIDPHLAEFPTAAE